MKIQELKDGWVIIVATFLQYVLGYPANILPMCGILFAPKYEEFGTSGTVSMNIVSIFVGPLVKAKSPRFVANLATSCQVLGILICSFSGSTFVIMIGFGIFVGAGVGISLVNNIIIVKKHFQNSIGIAFGTALTCICLAGLLIPQILKTLIEYFRGHNDVLNQWTLFIYAIMGCVGFLGAMLMTSEPGNEEAVPMDLESEQEESEFKQTCKEIIILLKDPDYVVTAVVNSCCFSIMVYFISLIGTIASSRNLEEESSNLVTIFSAANALSLLPMGFLGDSTIFKSFFKFPRKSLYIVCCIGLTFTILLFSFISSFPLLVVGTILCAIFTSGMFITTSLVYFDCFPTKFESAVGLSNLFRCISALSINPLAGYFASLSSCGDLHCSLHFLSGTIFLLILAWVGMTVLFERRQKRPHLENV